MDESDCQTERQTLFDARHRVGGENWSKWTNFKILKHVC